MKKIYTFLLAFTVTGLIILVSCKKKETPPAPDTRTKTQLIMLEYWKWTISTCNVAVDTDGKNGASTDLLSQMLACETDDTYLFKSDSTTTEKTNVKCKSNEPSSWKGTWIFTNAENNLLWDAEDYTVLELTSSKMVLKSKLVVGANTYEITDTYIH